MITLNILWIIIGILAGIILAYLWFGGNKKEDTKNGEDAAMNLLHQQMIELTRTVDQKLSESQKDVNESMKYQSSQSQNIIRDITERLTRLDETNKQVMSFTDQLQSLQDILKNPKQRGTILGEYYLETILQSVLPPKTYQTQYAFKNGDIVDAVVFVGGKIIPIDSKFSLENYNRIIESVSPTDTERFVADFKRDIKNRIDETSKYIKPDENTLDFAFMFIPHESIYYDLLVAEVGAIKINTQDLIQYAFSKKVILVSPTSFLAYLQTVLQGLRALQFEESAKEIRKNVEELSRHLKAYDEYHNKLGDNIATVVNQYTKTTGEFRKIDKDVFRITGASPDLTLLEIEKPKIEN
jgi:DNA recombination protein RmuC